MGISLPPEIRAYYDESTHERQVHIWHIWVETSRYFEPDVYWIRKQLQRFVDTGKNPLNYVLCETLRASGPSYDNHVIFTWVQKSPVGPFSANSNG